MTIPDPKETERKMARPVEEVAAELDPVSWGHIWAQSAQAQLAGRARSLEAATRVLGRLVQLGFLNDSYFVAKKAEEAGDEERTNT